MEFLVFPPHCVITEKQPAVNTDDRYNVPMICLELLSCAGLEQCHMTGV